MAKAKLRVINHLFVCGDNLGEGDAFFEFKPDGELVFIDGWSTNDAHWRGEYMSGLLAHVGVEVKELDKKYAKLGERLFAEAFGLEPDEDEDATPDHEGEQERVELYFREGTSDKVYNLEISASAAGAWKVVAEYGRNGGKLKEEIKCTGLDYDEAKDVYDGTLAGKLKKGYKQTD